MPKPTAMLKTKGNSEENCPVKADGNAEESGCPIVPEMLKPLEMLKPIATIMELGPRAPLAY